MRTENGDFYCNEKVSLNVGNADASELVKINDVFVTNKLNITTQNMMPAEWLDSWQHLKDIPYPKADKGIENVEILIGLNSSACRLIYEQRHGMENEPSAHLTKLGWVIFGPTGDMNRSQDLQVHHICSVANEGLSENFFNSTMFT